MFDLTVLGVVVVGVVAVDGVVVVAVSVVVVDGGLDTVLPLPEDVGVGVELTPPPPPHAANRIKGMIIAQARALPIRLLRSERWCPIDADRGSGRTNSRSNLSFPIL